MATLGTPETHPLTSLHTYHQNPRHGNVEAIAASLKSNGQFRPLVVNRGTHTGRPMEVLAGNHTLQAARQLTEDGTPGYDQIDCYVVDVDEDAATRIVLADNRTADLGQYDEHVLIDLLDGIEDIEGTGYDEDDLADLMAAVENEEAWDAGQGGAWDGDDADDDTTPGDGGGTGTADSSAAPVEHGALARRFIQPPFTVIDTRKGEWRQRKRQWVALGVNSGDGRDGELTYTSGIGKYGNWYDVRAKALAADPDITDTQIEERYAGELKPYGNGSGTSEFDPALAELLVTWFSAPGHLVLDPWAGGSVRGIVAAALGRRYTGIDLRPEQIEANREQWAAVQDRLPDQPAHEPTVDDVDDLTPVQQVGPYYLKRDDLFDYRGARGGKSRTMVRLLQETGAPGLITAGASISPQIERGALSAAAVGVPCRIHTGVKDTREVDTCKTAGAEVLQHDPSRLTVIKARCADDAEAHPDWLTIPYGMNHPQYVADVAAQCANLPDTMTRLVLPVGSGMTLSGVLQGMADAGLADVPILGVKVGGDPTAQLDEHAPGWQDRVELVDAEQAYEDAVVDPYLHGVSLDEHYEAKCLPFLQDGDLLWVVGRREASGPDLNEDTVHPQPEWLVGDSSAVMQATAPLHADMVIGCPPYYDLEEYSDDPADLSNMTPDEFDAAMLDTLQQADRHMQDDTFAVFVVGPVRNPQGDLMDMKMLMQQCARQIGWHYVNDAVLVNSAGSAALRAGGPFARSRTLSRVHQDVVVFCKGDRKKAAERCGTVQVVEIDADEQEGGQ